MNKWKKITFGVLVLSVLYHVGEGFVSIWYGLADNTVSLAAFGVDSAIEVFATMIVLYHMTVYELTVHEQSKTNDASSGNTGSHLVSLLYVLDFY